VNWKQIKGWFDFGPLYRSMVDWAPPNAHFVEIGAWMGKSTAFMGAEIKRSGKQIRFDVVDTWQGSPGEKQHRDAVAKLQSQGQTLFDVFKHNMKACGVHTIVNPLRMPSTVAAMSYADRSLDFVFIDGEHTYEAVKADIQAWLPKVRVGGVLAGHDWQHLPVRKAVMELLPGEHEKFPPKSWLHRVTEG